MECFRRRRCFGWVYDKHPGKYDHGLLRPTLPAGAHLAVPAARNGRNMLEAHLKQREPAKTNRPRHRARSRCTSSATKSTTSTSTAPSRSRIALDDLSSNHDKCSRLSSDLVGETLDLAKVISGH